MAEVEIDPKVRWEIHDEQVRERKRSARRWFLTGLALFVIGGLISGVAAMGGVYTALLAPVVGLGLIGMVVGAIKTLRAGRLSADVIREVEAKRRRSNA